MKTWTVYCTDQQKLAEAGMRGCEYCGSMAHSNVIPPATFADGTPDTAFMAAVDSMRRDRDFDEAWAHAEEEMYDPDNDGDWRTP